MRKSATQEGVEGTVAEELKPVVFNDSRQGRVAELAATARKVRDEEIAANGGEVVDTLNVAADPDDDEGEADEAQSVAAVKESAPVVAAPAIESVAQVTQPAAQQADPASTGLDDMITVKVDGVERQVARAQILDAGIRTVQKEYAADRRLEEATRLLNAARETVKPIPLPAEPDEVELAQMIQMGTPEQAAEALRIMRGRNATPDPAQFAATVQQQVMAKIDFAEQAKWFQTEYQEIFADPYLKRLALAEEDRLRDAGDTRPYREVYKEIGDGLRAKLLEWRGGAAAVTPDTAKQDRKSNIVNLPSASMRRAAPEQPKPRSAADVVEAMRKQRGQG